jgi:hypothetical protein
MAASKAPIVMRNPSELRPHPLNKELYGPPSANSAYRDIKADMERRSFDPRHPLLITRDDRILAGTTRWAVARALGVALVPCEVFVPDDPDNEELEAERELVRGNMYRHKDQVTLAREQAKMLEVEESLARRRMGKGSDGGPSKSSDRVGKLFGESGKTVQRRLQVLDAIDQAREEGQHKRADRLAELLNAGKTTKALDLAQGRTAGPARPPRVEPPRTLHDCATKAYSEFYEACAKAQIPEEVKILENYLCQMHDALTTAAGRVGGGTAG